MENNFLEKFLSKNVSTEAFLLSCEKYAEFKVVIIKLNGYILRPFFKMMDDGNSKGSFKFDQSSIELDWKRIDLKLNLIKLYLNRYFDYYVRRDAAINKQNKKDKTPLENKVKVKKPEFIQVALPFDKPKEFNNYILDSNEIRVQKNKINEDTGKKRSNSKLNSFPTGVKGVNFIQSFKLNKKNKVIGNASFVVDVSSTLGRFTTKHINKFDKKMKSCPANTYGYIQAIYQRDSLIKELKLNKYKLALTENNFQFIKNYGIQTWIEKSKFEEDFDMDEYIDRIPLSLGTSLLQKVKEKADSLIVPALTEEQLSKGITQEYITEYQKIIEKEKK